MNKEPKDKMSSMLLDAIVETRQFIAGMMPSEIAAVLSKMKLFETMDDLSTKKMLAVVRLIIGGEVYETPDGLVLDAHKFFVRRGQDGNLSANPKVETMDVWRKVEDVVVIDSPDGSINVSMMDAPHFATCEPRGAVSLVTASFYPLVPNGANICETSEILMNTNGHVVPFDGKLDGYLTGDVCSQAGFDIPILVSGRLMIYAPGGLTMVGVWVRTKAGNYVVKRCVMAYWPLVDDPRTYRYLIASPSDPYGLAKAGARMVARSSIL